MGGRRMFGLLFVVVSLWVAPSSSLAAEQPDEHASIEILSDRDFVRANGVRSGKGTVKNPYVISNWTLHRLTIENTSKAVRIVGNDISDLTLNFIGRNVEVRKNSIGDLRVNENVERTGEPTSGLFTQNTIGRVGQIRHFDGVFSRNTVGSDAGILSGGIFRNQAVAFDGFNGARFERNTVFGTVDIQLHGHHHSSSFGKNSHEHGSGHGKHAMVDHTKRYHSLVVSDNTIHSSDGYALAYRDTAHSANDRTANSEPEPELDLPHVHYTRIALVNNRLVGSGIMVDVFNARDSLHKGRPSGALTIAGNSIQVTRSWTPLFGPASGIHVERAHHLALRIASNTITADPPSGTQEQDAMLFGDGQGLLLDDLDHATVMIERLTVTNRQFGIRATEMTGSVRWKIRGLTVSGVDEPVVYDASVENAPDRR